MSENQRESMALVFTSLLAIGETCKNLDFHVFLILKVDFFPTLLPVACICGSRKELRSLIFKN